MTKYSNGVGKVLNTLDKETFAANIASPETLVKSKALVASSLTSNKIKLIRVFSYIFEFQVVGKHRGSFKN
jgi:hypothetical protein